MFDLSHWGILAILALFSLGISLLFTGGSTLVTGSSRFARLLGVHPVIIGLTVVALGTSTPEFVVSMVGALRGSADISLGNIVGSNVANIGLILGLAAFMRPISIHLRLLRFEVPLVIIVSVIFWISCANGVLSRTEGILLLAGFISYLLIVVYGSRKEPRSIEETYEKFIGEKGGISLNLLLIGVGIVALSFGADWVVTSAVELSRRLGASELLIGLTVVALGTSLPELATSVMAAVKKEGDISIGNIMGSNLFNMMAIAGPVAIARPLLVSQKVVNFQLPAMVIFTIALYPILRTGYRLGRIEATLLLSGYIFLVFLWIMF
jgi:cation:H+ antiporter